MIDRFAKRIKTASLKEQRLILSVLCILYSVFSFAQSNLTYILRIAATDEVELLDNFPASYPTENGGKYEPLRYDEGRDTVDFIFAHPGEEDLSAWGDSVYSYRENETTVWTVWRSKKEPKNRNQRVLVANGRNAFEQYLHETTETKRSHGWIWWVFAGLALALALAVAVTQIIQRRRERRKVKSWVTGPVSPLTSMSTCLPVRRTPD